MGQRGQVLGSVSSDPLAIFLLLVVVILRNLSSCFRMRGKDRLLPACRIASKPPCMSLWETFPLLLKTCLGALLYMETAI